MRILAGSVLALGLTLGSTAAPFTMTASAAMPLSAAPLAALAEPASAAPIVRAEYFCSPGYEPSSGGRCIAVQSRSEVDLYLDLPVYTGEAVRLHRSHRHHRHGMRERY